jgi:glutaredoxin
MDHQSEQAKKQLFFFLKIFGGLTVVAFAAAVALVPTGLPNVAFETASGASRTLCEGKSSCAVVYVTPWCPYCHQAVNTINSASNAMSRYPDIGLEVVVGKDQPGQVLAMAGKFGPATLLDEQGVLYASAGIRGVPAVFGVDSNQNITGRSGIYRGLSGEQLAEIWIEKLNLKK